MKTLILYASTYGYAEKCANKLAGEIGGNPEVIDVQKQAPESLDGYSAVILGGSIYMGQIQKKLKGYMEEHRAQLASKKLGLFVCSGIEDNVEQAFGMNFPAELITAAIAKEYFGGVLDTSKMGFGHRMITKMMESVNKKEGKKGPEEKPGNISKLAKAMKQA